MTRNVLDDLIIMNHILINYIAFLKHRISKEITYTENAYSKLDFQKLTVQSSSYVIEQMNYHISSMENLYSLLSSMEKMISDFYVQNRKPLPLYSKPMYKKTVQEHDACFKRILKQLGKHQLL